ncbi:MAG TPA: type II secretion system protein N [Gammaproteobacteria bacterium]
MTRPVLKFTVLAITVYLIALIALFPASLAVRWFAPAMPGLTLGPADGTIWQGRMTGMTYAGWNPGTLEWTLEPLSLLTLAAAADVRIVRPDAAPLSANLRMTPGGDLRISGLQGVLTLAALEKMRVVPRNIASGDVILNLEYLEIVNGLPVTATGRIGLTGLQSTFLPGIALGSYEAELEPVENGIRANFRDVEAPLRIAGEARLQSDGRYTVTGSVTPTGETPENLRRGLAVLGSPNASGSYDFSFSGEL